MVRLKKIKLTLKSSPLQKHCKDIYKDIFLIRPIPHKIFRFSEIKEALCVCKHFFFLQSVYSLLTLTVYVMSKSQNHLVLITLFTCDNDSLK